VKTAACSFVNRLAGTRAVLLLLAMLLSVASDAAERPLIVTRDTIGLRAVAGPHFCRVTRHDHHGSRRLPPQDVKRIAKRVLQAQRATQIIADYAYCPRVYDPCVHVSESLAALCDEVRAKVAGICAVRPHNP